MTRIRMLAAAAVMAGALAAAGCSPQAAAVDAVVLIGSDKTIIDHIASLGPMDCSMVRASLGDVWCVEDETVMGLPQPPQAKFCYRTLAEATCYDQPSPHPNDTLVGIVLPKLTAQPVN